MIFAPGIGITGRAAKSATDIELCGSGADTEFNGGGKSRGVKTIDRRQIMHRQCISGFGRLLQGGNDQSEDITLSQRRAIDFPQDGPFLLKSPQGSIIPARRTILERPPSAWTRHGKALPECFLFFVCIP